MVLYNKNDFKVLNLEHKSYPLRYDLSREIHASFPELYGKAIQFAKQLIDTRSPEDFCINFNGEPYQE